MEHKKRYLSNATMAIISLMAHKGAIVNDFHKMSEKIVELENEGIEIGDILVERDAIGYYSSQFAGFISFFENFGEAEKKNPLILFPEGEQRCIAIIQNACSINKEKISRIAQALHFDMSQICS